MAKKRIKLEVYFQTQAEKDEVEAVAAEEMRSASSWARQILLQTARNPAATDERTEKLKNAVAQAVFESLEKALLGGKTFKEFGVDAKRPAEKKPPTESDG